MSVPKDPAPPELPPPWHTERRAELMAQARPFARDECCRWPTSSTRRRA